MEGWREGKELGFNMHLPKTQGLKFTKSFLLISTLRTEHVEHSRLMEQEKNECWRNVDEITFGDSWPLPLPTSASSLEMSL